MMAEQIAARLHEMGFMQSDVLPPGPETRGFYVVRIRTKRGWFYLRPKGDDSDPLGNVEKWASQYEPV